jgi:hypothetical protein
MTRIVVGCASDGMTTVPGLLPGAARFRIRGFSLRSFRMGLAMEGDSSTGREPPYARISRRGTLPAMVRFSTKTLLFAFVLVALWFSTFSGYSAGRDVRASVLLIVFLTAGCAAIYSRGKGRAFWAGFFAVLLLSGGNVFEGPVNKYIPNFSWLTQSYYSSAVTLQYPPAASVVYSAPTPAAPQSVAQFIAAPTPVPAPPTATLVPVSLRDQNFAMARQATIEVAWMFALAVIIGLIAVWLYGTLSRETREL